MKLQIPPQQQIRFWTNDVQRVLPQSGSVRTFKWWVSKQQNVTLLKFDNFLLPTNAYYALKLMGSQEPMEPMLTELLPQFLYTNVPPRPVHVVLLTAM